VRCEEGAWADKGLCDETPRLAPPRVGGGDVFIEERPRPRGVLGSDDMNLDLLVPARARPVPPNDRTRLMLLVAITVFAVVSLAVAMIYASLYIELSPYRAGSFWIGVGLFLAAPLVTRLSASVDAGLAVALLAAMSVIVMPAYYQGGLNSVFLVWLVVIPMVATLYLRAWLGAVASVAGALIFAGFFLVHTYSELPPHEPEQENVLVLFNLVLALAFMASISMLARHALRRREAALEVAAIDAEASAQVIRERDEQLERAQRLESIGRLAGGVAHDFNNLLMVINGYTEAALDEARGQPDLEDSLKEVAKAGDRAAVLTRQLLAFGRRQLLEPQNVHLNEVVGELLEMVRRLLPENVVVEARLSDDLWNVFVDPHRIEQVLMNLAVNARDAMPEGGRLTLETANRVVAANEISGLDPGEYVGVTMRDTGIGMNEETRARVFEPFFTTKKTGKGTGLGLAMAYGTVTQSGGAIAIESALGEGCEIVLLLPRSQGAAQGAAETVEPVAAPTGTQDRERILVVEDESSVRRLIVDLLGRSGYRVEQASDGAFAAERLRTDEAGFDLLITDVVMPNLGGEALVRQCEAELGTTPVIFLSGYVEHEIQVGTFAGRTVEVIQKPVHPKRLLLHIRHLLDRGLRP